MRFDISLKYSTEHERDCHIKATQQQVESAAQKVAETAVGIKGWLVSTKNVLTPIAVRRLQCTMSRFLHTFRSDVNPRL